MKKISESIDEKSRIFFCGVILPDGKTLATAGDSNKVQLWDIQSGHIARSLEGFKGHIHALSPSPDGSQLAAASENTVLVWKLETEATEPNAN